MAQINAPAMYGISFNGSQVKKSNTPGKVIGGLGGFFAVSPLINHFVSNPIMGHFSKPLSDYFVTTKEVSKGISILDLIKRSPDKLQKMQEAGLTLAFKMNALPKSSKIALVTVPLAVAIVTAVGCAKLGGKIQEKLRANR